MTAMTKLPIGRATAASMAEEKISLAKEKPASGGQIKLARDVADYIDSKPGETFTLQDLAAAFSVSPWHLQRCFKKVLGVSPKDYADQRRGEQFRQELKSGNSVALATYGAGYGSSSRVYERAEGFLGMTPASYAKGGKGARIRYTIVPSTLGPLLVATTGRGVCFVALGDDDGALVDELKSEFPAADEIARDDENLTPAVASLTAYLQGRAPHAELPLDVRATAFQRRVWQELLAIPCGETRTYSEIAAKLGLPKAQRAVGRACATNPVSLLIPCHRALRSDGKLAGYRWGINRKKALLELEGVE
jgi:AraC family transcriptional regulator of adaptative response/methylated-DNA-[protein]-cysteine methyltransferase